MSTGPDTKNGECGNSEVEAIGARTKLISRIAELFRKSPRAKLVTPKRAPVSLSVPARIAWNRLPFELTLGKFALEFHPDLSVSGSEGAGGREWIVHAGKNFRESVAGFARIETGASVLFGRADRNQEVMFGFDRSVANRHVQISNNRGDLTIWPLELDRDTSIADIESPATVWMLRAENVRRLPDVLGHALTPMADDEAQEVVSDVNRILANEVYRDLDDDGVPGGVIKLPDDMTVVILGDIHARADNLLRVLTEGGLLVALERNEAGLVLLGDLVHRQETDELEEMESSILVLDLFCLLKRRFPRNIFYLHGNHESFSPDVGKGGVPQGLLFRKHLRKRRGKTYVAEIEALFSKLAFVVQGNNFAACHGAPVRSKVDRNTLVNIRRYPGIQYELIWNRLRRGNRPGGYGKGSVKRFRRTLDLSKHAPMIVSHTPLSDEEALWLNVGEITGHHIVYSAHAHRFAAIVMDGGQMIPLHYTPDPAFRSLIQDNLNQSIFR